MARGRWTPQTRRAWRERMDELNRTLIEEVELLMQDNSAEQVAARLGTTCGALGRRLYRLGRPELGRCFNRAAKAARRVVR